MMRWPDIVTLAAWVAWAAVDTVSLATGLIAIPAVLVGVLFFSRFDEPVGLRKPFAHQLGELVREAREKTTRRGVYGGLILLGFLVASMGANDHGMRPHLAYVLAALLWTSGVRFAMWVDDDRARRKAWDETWERDAAARRANEAEEQAAAERRAREREEEGEGSERWYADMGDSWDNDD